MTDNSNSIIDLSSLQGQIANLVLSLNGLDQQQSFDPKYLPGDTESENGITNDKLNFIHDLENLIIFSDDTKPAEPSNGMSTYYISTYIYLALLALNKYVNEVTYGTNNDAEIIKSTNPIRPFAGAFSQDLFCIIKKDGFYKISKKKSTTQNENNYVDLEFKKDVTLNSTLGLSLTKRDDLLNQNNFYLPEGQITNNYWNAAEYKSLVPVGLTSSDYNFGANMRKLLTDLYKEYYYYEILDIQKRLNRKHEGSSKLETELRLLLQKARNAFTREIYKPDVDITSEFPMSDIMYELNDYIAEMDSSDITSTYNDLKLFDENANTTPDGTNPDDADGTNPDDDAEDTEDVNILNLYQFVEEKTHMMNMVGNAIHYGLELSKRIQRMREYTDATNEDTITDENPHFEQNTFSEDHCIKGIDEGMAMIRNLIDDLRLLTGDSITSDEEEVSSDVYKQLHKHLEHELDECLNNCNDIYYNFNKLKEDTKFIGNSKPVFYDFDNNQLQQLGVLDILKKVYESHDFTTSFSVTEQNFKTYSKFKNNNGKLVSRYNNPLYYNNYALLIIKIVIMLGILHNFRIIQTYNFFKDVNPSTNTRNAHDSKILTALNKPLPKDLSIMEFVKIEELKKQLRKKLSTTREDNIPKSLVLPGTIDVTPDKDEALKACFKCILEIMNKMAETEITKNIDDQAVENLFKRFYPFTKSMMYQFDEYFTTTNTQSSDNDYNKEFTNDEGINFNLLTNSLNYVAQGIVGSEIEKYTNEDFEKILIKLIYLCNCITVNWSHMDDAIHKDIDLSKTSIYNLFKEDFGNEIDSFDDLLKSVSTSIYTSTNGQIILGQIDNEGRPIDNGYKLSGTETTHLTTKFINFIHKEMKNMLQSDLPLVVKYVYWVVLYCINSYFIHLRTRFAHEVLTKNPTAENLQEVSQ